MENLNSLPMKEKEEKVHFGHVGIIALCAAFLIFATWMKSGFNLSLRPIAQSSSAGQVLTYEQAKAEVLAQMGPAPTTDGSVTDQQLALVDPVNHGGEVAGTSTAEQVFPSADQMVTPEMLDQIKIKTTDVSNADTIKTYSDRVAFVEAQYNALGILSDLNNQDSTTLKNVDITTKAIVSNLAQIPVPKELVTYHKIKMMYYTTLGYMAQAFSGENKNIDLERLSSILFSLTEKLDSIQGEIMTNYNVQL